MLFSHWRFEIWFLSWHQLGSLLLLDCFGCHFGLEFLLFLKSTFSHGHAFAFWIDIWLQRIDFDCIELLLHTWKWQFVWTRFELLCFFDICLMTCKWICPQYIWDFEIKCFLWLPGFISFLRSNITVNQYWCSSPAYFSYNEIFNVTNQLLFDLHLDLKSCAYNLLSQSSVTLMVFASSKLCGFSFILFYITILKYALAHRGWIVNAMDQKNWRSGYLPKSISSLGKYWHNLASLFTRCQTFWIANSSYYFCTGLSLTSLVWSESFFPSSMSCKKLSLQCFRSGKYVSS